ncbi:MAG TPA: sigma factor-like helix-turn-helix DNA-binding protein [Allosphingosinicella sp.]|nr:sigma factor-like helix-turn-helix DNA-binding protein [Allosphingosinicella sp.]
MGAGDRELRVLQLAFGILPPVTREVFRLHRVEGLDYAEVAARLGMTALEVERHVAEALYELARRVDRPWWKLW